MPAPELRAVERTKTCTRCGQRKPWSEFHAKAKWPDGSTRHAQPHCKPCHAAYTSERRKAGLEKRPDYKRAYARKVADPEQRAVTRAYGREWYRRTHNVPPERYRTIIEPRDTAGGPAYDAAPFIAWLRTLGTTSTEIARVCGLRDDHVRQYLMGKVTVVALDVVDRACLHADHDLNDLYPLETAA